jgi:hypothetical protein
MCRSLWDKVAVCSCLGEEGTGFGAEEVEKEEAGSGVAAREVPRADEEREGGSDMAANTDGVSRWTDGRGGMRRAEG